MFQRAPEGCKILSGIYALWFCYYLWLTEASCGEQIKMAPPNRSIVHRRSLSRFWVNFSLFVLGSPSATRSGVDWKETGKISNCVSALEEADQGEVCTEASDEDKPRRATIWGCINVQVIEPLCVGRPFRWLGEHHGTGNGMEEEEEDCVDVVECFEWAD